MSEMFPLVIERLPDDPICLRASIGGDAQTGYYCRFRGDQQAVIGMVRLVLKALEVVPPLAIEPDKGQGPQNN